MRALLDLGIAKINGTSIGVYAFQKPSLAMWLVGAKASPMSSTAPVI
jgi:hypothetical protein